MEGTFRSYNPLMYKVNNVSDIDTQILNAYTNKDQLMIAELLKGTKNTFNVFICVNKSWHAFLLIVPANEPDDNFLLTKDLFDEDVFKVPSDLLVWKYELAFEKEEQRWYKIKISFNLFKDLKDKIKRAYFIGQYKDVHPKALQLAALRASPNRYNVLLDDCVEFAKEFCVCMLSYCTNYGTLEEQVYTRIKQATASGLSVEQLSRRIESSGRVGNTFLGGFDVTTFLGAGVRTPLVVLAFLLYPVISSVIVTVLVVKMMKD